MTATLLDGRSAAEEILGAIVGEVSRLDRPPHLAILRVGENEASRCYVERKCATAKRIGIRTTSRVLTASANLEEIIGQIDRWNGDSGIHGILVQMPLPDSAMHGAVFDAIDPKKDVDGFNPHNFGLLAQGRGGGFVPCTPNGIVHLLRRYGIATSGRHVVVIGRSTIVGRPLSLLLQSRGMDATVTQCHSKSENLREIAKSGHILISAAGSPGLVGGDWIGDGAVVVDVGQNFIADPSAPSGKRLVGDVDFAAALDRCSYVTPVPGGVGPLTVAMLMKNVLMARIANGC
ncbi:MAG: bifunctional 5,10-methylenetetrahydrofolate dehydrogenase/5,10-methenyltetrahydrofolate cyclohydrolase [Puniceicoccales bacterium]|jgi:5,10-methylene-tetrahydrofolate dehydrogenase/methenyl tetrahydrofolate cyclohydrolase|nr:bifunctional 5,10-methylenetetrahydrofolate dehydrogenase/5,10-methenyltetrahydrofolate cyclohydrolase [Puniceicoccales bacterium]